jgi:hypothetical protein
MKTQDYQLTIMISSYKREMKLAPSTNNLILFRTTFNQQFDFVHNHIMHARCPLPTNYISLMSFLKILEIKKMFFLKKI